MILVVTHKADFTADFVIHKLNELSIPFYRLNCEDIPTAVSISLDSNTEFIPRIDGESKFQSIWFRRTKLPEINIEDQAVKSYYLSELSFFQKNLWETLSAKWLSHPDAIYRAENKLLQLKTAINLGFSIPKTLVSSEFTDIRSFYSSLKGQVIIKPLFNNRYFSQESRRMIYTSLLMEDDLQYLEDSLPLPSIYQEYIPKHKEIRVTIVGDDIFTACVNSQNCEVTLIDWRKQKLPFQACHLPKSIEDKCRDLIKTLGLSFGAID